RGRGGRQRVDDGFGHRWHRVEREGDVLITAAGASDAGPTIDADPEVSAVGDAAATDIAAAGVTQTERIANVVAAVEVAKCRHAAVGNATSRAAVAARGPVIVRLSSGDRDDQAEDRDEADERPGAH